jgi:hypothetical protein
LELEAFRWLRSDHPGRRRRHELSVRRFFPRTIREAQLHWQGSMDQITRRDQCAAGPGTARTGSVLHDDKPIVWSRSVGRSAGRPAGEYRLPTIGGRVRRHVTRAGRLGDGPAGGGRTSQLATHARAGSPEDRVRTCATGERPRHTERSQLTN